MAAREKQQQESKRVSRSSGRVVKEAASSTAVAMSSSVEEVRDSLVPTPAAIDESAVSRAVDGVRKPQVVAAAYEIDRTAPADSRPERTWMICDGFESIILRIGILKSVSWIFVKTPTDPSPT